MNEAVNHPDHYKSGKYECIDVMSEIYGVDKTLDFCLLNAFKYLWRSTSKENFRQDLAKAKWYIDKCLELTNPLNNETN